LNDSIEQINLERLTRDYRRAVDFDSFEVEGNARMDPDQRLIERERGLNTE
jgi:hypothetical protein